MKLTDAAVLIVRSFNESGGPRYGLAALAMILLSAVAGITTATLTIPL